MNKMAKGALAIGVGAALLLGGGTLATWNATANASAGTITAGELAMSTSVAGAWTSSASGVILPTAVAAYRAVPGEVLTYSQTLKINLNGDNITAKLEATGAVAAKAFGDEANVRIEYNTTAADESKWVSAATGVTATPLALAKGEHTVRARIVVDFVNITTGAGNTTASMKQSANLSGVGFKLTQNAPTTQGPVAP